MRKKRKYKIFKNKVKLVLLLLLMISFLNHSNVFADEANCVKEGILVRNLSLNDLWFKKDDGPCTILKRNKNFVIKPEDEVIIFSNMNCQAQYCDTSTFDGYKSFDINGNCRVKILPGCHITDM